MQLIRRAQLEKRKSRTGRVYKVSRAIFCCLYCGKEKNMSLAHGYKCKSCGCVANKLRAISNTKHNDSKAGKGHRLYSIWCSIKTRCTNVNRDTYKYYGGKGIKFCGEWENYVNFKQWALNNGYKSDLTIDRIDNKGDYCPKNCQWILREENSAKEKGILKKEDVYTIRSEYRKSQLPYKTIAQKYGVARTTIGALLRGETWKQQILPHAKRDGL